MFETFRRIRYNLIVIAVVCILIGVTLIADPVFFLKTACYVIGAVLIASGVLPILSCVRDREVRVVTLFCSMIAVAAGIFIISNPEVISSILPIILGFILLLDGLVNLRHGFGLRQMTDSTGGMVLLMGAATVVLGIVILCNPFATAAFSLRLIGAAMIYNGISDLVIIFRMNRAAKNNIREENAKYIDVDATPIEEDDD